MTVVDRTVAIGADDSLYWDSNWDNTFGDWDAGDFTFFAVPSSEARFIDVAVPKDAIISVAYLTLRAESNQSGTTVRTNLEGEASDNATQIASYADYISRARTSASVPWDSIAAWTKDADYQSVSIVSIIQEIVNRANWVSGNALRIFWDDDGSDSGAGRKAYSYDTDITYCARLHIEYTTAAGRSFGFIIG